MKESYYLRHDYNSRNDEKILRLRQKYPNGSGYAIFWMLLEKLAESSEGRIKIQDIDVLAFELQMDSKWITDVVLTSGLFESDKKFFWSNRLLSDLAERNEKSTKAILANKIRWDKARKEAIKNPDGLQMDSEMESKERKGKEKKEEKSKVGYMEPSVLTPSQSMRNFIKSVNEKDSVYYDLLDKLAEGGFEKEECSRELDKFVDYWCELNKSGTKQRWETEATFEVKLRLKTWFRNYANKFSRSQSTYKKFNVGYV